MATAVAKTVKSEDVLGEKWDKCLVDGGIKVTSGLAIGLYFILNTGKWPLMSNF